MRHGVETDSIRADVRGDVQLLLGCVLHAAAGLCPVLPLIKPDSKSRNQHPFTPQQQETDTKSYRKMAFGSTGKKKSITVKSLKVRFSRENL
jgi:hypothetical protein